MVAVEKEIPWCTIFLVLGAFVSNIFVLIGNLDAAASFTNIGQSTGGWSGVGTALADAFDKELATLMNNVTLSLSHAVADITHVNSELDMMISVVGGKSDASLLQLAHGAAEVAVRHHANRTHAAQFPGMPVFNPYAMVEEAAKAEIAAVVKFEVGKANKLLTHFLKAITPALIQIGKWEISFGSKLQEDISQFGTTIDWVQKSFDSMMAKLKGPDPAYEQVMLYNTFDLFDPTANNCITEKDLLGAAAMYGITALSGIKGESVFEKYSGSDGCIDSDEYIGMVNDPGLNGIVTTVLRTYSEGLSKVAGTIGQARLRSAVASSVVTYFDLVSAKNHTKVGWICERITNGSLPMAFTSVVLMELAFSASNPNVLSTIPVGPLVVEFMLYQNMSYTLEAFEMMSQPSFWTTEGFLPTHLASTVETVGQWIQAGINATKMGTNPAMLHTPQYNPLPSMPKKKMPKKQNSDKSSDKASHASLLEETSGTNALAQAEAKFKSGYVARLQATAAAEIKRQKHQDHVALIERRESLTESHTSQHLFRELLGGKTMSKGSLNPTEWQVLHQGVPAVPATLEFAKFLAWNSSSASAVFLHDCFKYSSTSSNQLDAFANEIQNFVGMTQSFLTTIMSYSGEKGIMFLEGEILNFVKGAEIALVSALIPKVDAIVDSVVNEVQKTVGHSDPLAVIAKVKGEIDSIMSGGASTGSSMAMLQLEVNAAGAAVPAKKEGAVAAVEGDVLMVFEEMHILMGDLMALLPSAVSTVNGARDEVSRVAQMMTSIFATFGTLGPELFNDISFAYSALWTTYFVLLLPMVIGTLFYGLWASGFFGGPQAADWPEETEEEAARPKSFGDRMSTCYNACCICCGKCHDSMMCFWSCIIIYQVIVLAMFIVGILLCMLNGINLFLDSSCLEIYMLSQSDMCLSVLNSVKGFISTFTVDPLIPLEQTCDKKSLLMCQLIGEKMNTSMVYTSIFSFASAILQYQLVIESAILHERARMRRIVQELQKRP